MDDPSDDWFCASTLTGHTSTVWALAWAPGGTYLASASDDKTVRIWRVSKDGSAGECVGTLAGHQRSVYSVTWGRGKGKEGSLGWLATSGGDGVIRVWEIEVRIYPCLLGDLSEHIPYSRSPRKAHQLLVTL